MVTYVRGKRTLVLIIITLSRNCKFQLQIYVINHVSVEKLSTERMIPGYNFQICENHDNFISIENSKVVTTFKYNTDDGENICGYTRNRTLLTALKGNNSYKNV